jgi:hypothetical protein
MKVITNTRYGALDAAILAALGSNPMHFTHLMGDRQVGKEAVAATKPTRPSWPATTEGPREPDRTLDRRLQALRRAGKITFDSKTGWLLVQLQSGGNRGEH